MKDATHPHCGEKQCRRSGRALCFPIQVSRLEQSLGHEVFECERCHRQYKITPSSVTENTNVRVKAASTR